MISLIAIPILLILMILQTTLVSEFTLLNGSADLILLWISAWALRDERSSSWLWAILGSVIMIFVSAVPWYAVIAGYFSVMLISKLIHRKFWQTPLISTFFLVIVGSIFLYLFTFVGLRLGSTAYDWNSTMVQVIIPSIFLNLFLSIPVFVIVRDTYSWIYRREESV